MKVREVKDGRRQSLLHASAVPKDTQILSRSTCLDNGHLLLAYVPLSKKMESNILSLYLGRLPPVVVFLLRLFRPLLVKKRFVGFGQFDALLPAERRGVMGLVPLTERRRVDGNDGVLDEGLGTHQLVVAGVVDGIDDTRLTRDRLGAPREVASVQSGWRE